MPLGLGHAVWCARELVGHEPFALLLPDVLVQHERGCLAQMIDAARGLPDEPNIIAVEEVPAERVHMYGVVGVGERQGKLFEITQMVEKPTRERRRRTSSSPAATSCSRRSSTSSPPQKRGAGGEIQLTDAMIELAKTPAVLRLEFEGRSFDCGSKIGFLAANVAYALERPDIAPALRAEIKRLMGD